jgi:lipoprotein-anchoring transpeptidase ErfK/SrfK
MSKGMTLMWSAAFAALLVGAAPVAAQTPVAAQAQPAVAIEAEPGSLDPGQFVWHPEAAPAGAVEIVVSIPQQIAYVYRGGTLIGVSTVSTGRPGHRTPTGRFAILEKDRIHHSNRYNNAPMPFMQRLTMDGIALHAGEIPGHPASHGCVRLPLAFARDLFAVTEVGARVHIIDAAPTSETALSVAQVDGPGLVRLASAR